MLEGEPLHVVASPDGKPLGGPAFALMTIAFR
jgi:hypothetical protein